MWRGLSGENVLNQQIYCTLATCLIVSVVLQVCGVYE